MIRSLWIAKTGLDAQQTQLDVTSNNLANVATNGFKRIPDSVGYKIHISVWGNDFTLHAPATRRMGELTRLTMANASALHADCQRDIRLAQQWGFPKDRQSIVLPGSGGIQLDWFYPPDADGESQRELHPTVINPRGFRSGSVRNDTFFKSIPLILSLHPDVQFVCPWMAGQAEALRWVNKLRIFDNVSLLPMISQAELWREFARSLVSVSVSEHDGTPNSLLEAMSIGCLPVCGDIESIREWITNGENGILVDPTDPYALAEAVQRGITDSDFRRTAAERNLEIIRTRAEVSAVRQQVVEFYSRMTGYAL